LGRIANGSPHVSTAAEAVKTLHDFLDGSGAFVQHGFAAASSTLNEAIRAVRNLLPTFDPGSEAQLATLVSQLDLISDRLTEEVAELQELVGVQLDLAAIA